MTTKELLALVDSLQESITDWGDNMRNEAMVDLLDHAHRIRAALPALCAEVEAKDAKLAAEQEAYDGLADKYEQQTREVEALRKDAERLDWLQRVARTSTVHMGGQHPWNLTGNHKLHNLRGPDLRAAIDAAKEPK